MSFIVGTRELELKGQRDIGTIRSIQHYSCHASSISGRTVEGKVPFVILDRTKFLLGPAFIQRFILFRRELVYKFEKP